MKVLIFSLVVLSVAAVALGNNPFGGLMQMAQGGMQQMTNAFAQAFGGDKEMAGMIDQATQVFQKAAEGVAGQGAGFADEAQKMFTDHMSKLTEEGQKQMKPFMEKMEQLKSKGADPKEFLQLMDQMKKATNM